jgi:WD40-like Beta Propeller Repeat
MTRFLLLRGAGARLRDCLQRATPLLLAALLPAVSMCGGKVLDGDEPERAVPDGANSNPPAPTGTRDLPIGDSEHPSRPSGPSDVAPRCDPSSPFATPVPVAGLTVQAGEPVPEVEPYEPSLSPDELTVYFERFADSAYEGIFVAHRSSTDTAFSGIERLDLPRLSNHPSVSSDGRALYFSYFADASHGGILDLRVATRGSVTEPFQGVSVLPGFVDGSDGEYEPFLSTSGKDLYYMKAGDIFQRRWAASAWEAEERVGGLDGPHTHWKGSPVVSRDARTIYITGSEWPNSWTMFVAHRATANGPFEPPTPMPGGALSSSDPGHFLSDGDPAWLSEDGCRLYFDAWQDVNGRVARGIYVAHHVDE